MTPAEELIQALDLRPHPEGGFYRETYRSTDLLALEGAVVSDPAGYALVGGTVAPGFDFADFELADRAALVAAYPQHRALIERLTP